MAVLGWIVFGLIVGIVAKFLTPGRDPGGFIVTILLGIAGALLGGFLGRAAGWYHEGDPVGFVMAVVGSIVLLVLYRLVAETAPRVIARRDGHRKQLHGRSYQGDAPTRAVASPRR